MSGSHEKLPGLFWVQLVLAAVIGILWLFDPGAGGHADAEAKADPTMAAALKPIGNVAIAQPAVEAGAPRSGDAIVEKNCKVCHSIGLANAPKLDESAKADWEARLAGGYDAVLASAIKGKGGMPPRGGDPTLTDDEISSAILNMLSTVGVEVAEAGEVKAADAAPEVKIAEAEPTKKVAASDEKVAKVVPAKVPDAKVAEVAPAKEIAPVKEAAPIKETAVAAKSAETAVKSVTAKPTVKTVEAKPAAAIMVTELGESTYKSSCFACHDSGVANSPKVGDKAVWAPRIAQGISALHTAAIKGKGAMPGKGGNPSLSDQAVMEAVNFMVVNSQ